MKVFYFPCQLLLLHCRLDRRAPHPCGQVVVPASPDQYLLVLTGLCRKDIDSGPCDARKGECPFACSKRHKVVALANMPLLAMLSHRTVSVWCRSEAMKPVYFVGSSRNAMRELLKMPERRQGTSCLKCKTGRTQTTGSRCPQWGQGLRKSASGKPAEPIGFSMWRSLRKRSRCCMSLRSGLRRHRIATFSWQKPDMPTC